MVATAISLLFVSLTAAIPPAVILGAIVFFFDESSGMYTALAVFVWKFCEYVRLSIECILEPDNED